MFMQSSSDSSIWRSLAVAFGDGLAFGVGVKLSQNAARQIGAAQRAEPGDLGNRLSQVEQTIKRIERAPAGAASDQKSGGEPKSGLDQKVLEAIVNALEARLKEQAGQTDRRLADLEARLTLEMKALDEQDHSIAAQVTRDLNALEGQLVAVNREFGEAVARIVTEQVTAQVEAQAVAAERSLEERIARAVDQAVEQRVSQAIRAGLESVERRLAEIDTSVEQRLAAAVRQRLEPIERQLRQEIGQKEGEIAELRQQLAEADTNLLDVVSGIGQVCRQAAERMASPTPPTPGPVTSPAGVLKAGIAPHDEAGETESEAPADSSGETPLPGFAQPQKPNRLWRVPLVSSLVMLATGGLILIRYL